MSQIGKSHEGYGQADLLDCLRGPKNSQGPDGPFSSSDPTD